MILGEILICHRAILARQVIQQQRVAVQLASHLQIVHIRDHAQSALMYAGRPALSCYEPCT